MSAAPAPGRTIAEVVKLDTQKPGSPDVAASYPRKDRRSTSRRWVAGLLGYWVAELLGCWVTGLLGSWVAGLLLHLATELPSYFFGFSYVTVFRSFSRTAFLSPGYQYSR
jgi:hypothetical protein